MMMDLVIDDGFHAQLPLIRPEERSALEESIKAQGCRDKLTAWNHEGELVLIDGHNRYEICRELGIDFEIDVREFDSRDAVEEWIDKNQIERRNLASADFKIVLGRIYNRKKKAHGGKRSVSKVQGAPLQSTAERIGENHRLSADSVKRHGKRAEIYDIALQV